jgi:hypothetical protein
MKKILASFQAFRDSSLVINVLSNKAHLHNIILLPLVEWIKEISRRFTQILYRYIYRGIDTTIDRLSKEGVQLRENKVIIHEFAEGEAMAYYQFQLQD